MSLPRVKYSGASVENFRCALGLGDRASSLTLTLVEDTRDNDIFIYPSIGQPSYFNCNGWIFGGIVQNFTRNRGSDGFRYEVVINDPRSILSGTQLIMSGYTGSTHSIPNLYNVYGYIESTYGYGAAGVSEVNGILATLAINSVQALTNSSPIKLLGIEYYVDFTNLLNVVPADYRIQQSSLSIFDLINEIASVTVSDYFIRLEYINNRHYIIPYFVSRANTPPLDTIYNFVSTSESVNGNVSNIVGREFVTETTSKFLVGGNVNYAQFVFQNKSDEIVDGQALAKSTDLISTYANEYPNEPDIVSFLQDEAEEANIWPYWGNDINGNTIVGYGPPSARWAVLYDTNGRRIGASGPQWVGMAAHRFTLDGRALAEIYKNPAFSDYTTDNDEMYFSLFGFDQWLYYIIFSSSLVNAHPNNNFNNSNKTKFHLLELDTIIGDMNVVVNGNNIGKIPSGGNIYVVYQQWINSMRAQGIANPSFDRFLYFAGSWFNHNLNAVTSVKAVEQTRLQMSFEEGFLKKNPTIMDKLRAVYSFIRDYADKYYGKKFMVRIPSIKVKRDSETGEVLFNLKPTDGGYVDDGVYPQLIGSGLAPSDINKVTLDDGRLQAYVRYPLYTLPIRGTLPETVNDMWLPSLDIKDVQHDALWSWSQANPNAPKVHHVFVKCDIEEKPVFLDNNTLDSPRFVITLPGRVCANEDYRSGAFANIMVNYMWWLLEFHNANNGINLTQAQKQTVFTRIFNYIRSNFGSIGGDKFNAQEEYGPATMPDMVVLTLEDETQSYGPWYAAGAESFTEYQKDDGLVPWNFAGYEGMNATANSMVNTSITNTTEIESGNVQIPGIPAYMIGDAFATNGPIITDIQVSVDAAGGATTTYNMQTWTARFGEMQKYYIDKMVRLKREIQKNQRGLRDIINDPMKSAGTVSNLNFIAGMSPKSPTVRRLKRNTSTSEYLMGEVLYQADENGNRNKVRSRLAFTPEYYLESQTLENYNDKAVVSLDAIFRPFTTNSSPPPSSLPHLETPDVNASAPTVDDLNPFRGSHDIGLISQVETVDDTFLNSATADTNLLINPYIEDTTQSAPTSIKSIALRGPLLLTGWGYDTDGNPVPAKSNVNEFIPDFKVRMDQWKTGPVDLRWDDDRKVWTGPNKFNNIYKGQVITSPISYAGSGLVRIHSQFIHGVPPVDTGYNNNLFTSQETVVYAYNMCTKRDYSGLLSNDIVIVAKIDKDYYVMDYDRKGYAGIAYYDSSLLISSYYAINDGISQYDASTIELSKPGYWKIIYGGKIRSENVSDVVYGTIGLKANGSTILGSNVQIKFNCLIGATLYVNPQEENLVNIMYLYIDRAALGGWESTARLSLGFTSTGSSVTLQDGFIDAQLIDD